MNYWGLVNCQNKMSKKLILNYRKKLKIHELIFDIYIYFLILARSQMLRALYYPEAGLKHKICMT